eukprot:scaffold2726_cov167-Amphora_coffeaeformis.AAC.18
MKLLSLLLSALFLSHVAAFVSQLPQRQKLALTVTKKDMMDAPSKPTSDKPSKPKGNKAKRKDKSAAAAAIADEINGKPPKKKVTNK